MLLSFLSEPLNN